VATGWKDRLYCLASAPLLERRLTTLSEAAENVSESEGVVPARITRVLVVLGVLGIAAAAFAALQLAAFGTPRFHGTEYPDAPPAPAFTLTDHGGNEFSLSDRSGGPVLLFFGFTRCPDVCPRTLARLTRIMEDARIEPDRLEVLLITVDPDHDTPEVLADYVDQFRGRVRGLAGDPTTVAAILAEYGVYAQATEGHGGHPTIAHTNLVFGIDAANRLRVLIRADEPDEIVLADLRTLLRLRG
jgi:protein SCO1